MIDNSVVQLTHGGWPLLMAFERCTALNQRWTNAGCRAT